MPELDKSELLAAFMEGQLTGEQRAQFEQLCISDSEFAQQVEWANRLSMQAQEYHPVAVPEWDRAGTFVKKEKPARWWQWQGLPVASMAFSLCAMVMVVSGFQVKVDDGALTISFNQFTDNQQVEQLVQKRLDEFKANQQQALATYAQSLQQQQLDASTQLTNYLLASSRKERREDFGEFIKFINEQRNEDQLFYARQLNQLQQDMYSKVAPGQWDGVDDLNRLNQE